MATKKKTTHKCPECSFKAKSKGGLTQHIKKKHGEGQMQTDAKNTGTPAPVELEAGALISDVKGMVNPGGYVTLILYIALPRVYRASVVGADTQEKLAEKLEVDVATLSRWKNRPGFWEDVKNVQVKYFTERIGDVILAQENEAIKGHTPAARLVLEAVGYLKKDEDKSNVPELLAVAIKNVSSFLDK